jgi:hypothetical protein
MQGNIHDIIFVVKGDSSNKCPSTLFKGETYFKNVLCAS